MTREEAIKVLEAEKKFLFHGSLSDKHYEPAFDMAIDALQENESLAKSVNDAAELIRKLQKKNEGILPERLLDDVSTAFEDGYKQGKFEALQSQQKTGKWKLLHKGNDTSDYECTNCLGILMDVVNDDTHELQSYCGMCGARMVGEEE